MSEAFLLDGSDLAPVINVMDRLTAAGKGWIDVIPAGMEPPAPTSVWGRINGRGPLVPRLTWTAPQPARRKPEPAAIGIEHPSGPRALVRLDAAGHALPAGWRRLQDHSMRGLVLQPPADAQSGTVFGWSLRAVQILGGIDSTRWSVRILGEG